MKPLVAIHFQGRVAPLLCPSKQKAILVYMHLQKNYHEAVSLKKLSHLFSIRSDVLSREFKRQYGTGPLTFLRARRVEEARRLLSRRGFTIKEVCYRVDFSNPQAFCKVFKRLTRFSPQAYRQDTSRLYPLGPS